MTDDVLKGKAVLITGAGSGLGEATARAFARAGCAVACVDLNRRAAERVAAELAALDCPSLALECDVSDAEAVFRTVETVVGQFGRLDVAVNCAAIDYVLPVGEMTVEQWDRVLAVNLRGPFLVAKAAWPAMQRQRSGHIVNIASTAATRAWANASAYHASKWGLLGMSHGLHVEGRPHNIKVTAIINGGMRTPFILDRFPDTPLENLQDPKNVAKTIRFVLTQPRETVIPEVLVLPMRETSWP